MVTTSELPKGYVGEGFQPQIGIDFCPCCWPGGLKYFSGIVTYKRCNYFQGVIYNTYHGGHVETGHHVILLMPEDVSNYSMFPNFTPPGLGTFKGVIYNDTTDRDKMPPNGLWLMKGAPETLFMMFKPLI